MSLYIKHYALRVTNTECNPREQNERETEQRMHININVFFPDQGMGAVYFNKGENCIAAGRLFVEESIHDEFVSKVVSY